MVYSGESGLNFSGPAPALFS
ncbi:hypothetical protein SMJ63A_160111 [Stenotrophomonas geniculata]